MESIDTTVADDLVYTTAQELTRFFNLYIGNISGLARRMPALEASLKKYKGFKNHLAYRISLVDQVETFLLHTRN